MSLWCPCVSGCPEVFLGILPECPLLKKFIVKTKFRAGRSGCDRKRAKARWFGEVCWHTQEWEGGNAVYSI